MPTRSLPQTSHNHLLIVSTAEILFNDSVFTLLPGQGAFVRSQVPVLVAEELLEGEGLGLWRFLGEERETQREIILKQNATYGIVQLIKFREHEELKSKDIMSYFLSSSSKNLLASSTGCLFSSVSFPSRMAWTPSCEFPSLSHEKHHQYRI